MGNITSNIINFEDMKQIINDPNYLIIHVLSTNDESCLIKNTLKSVKEEYIINQNLRNLSKNIVVYGKNSGDYKAQNKIKQLSGLGFRNIYFYSGGMFEWLMLQEIFGADEFETDGTTLDLLKFKPSSQLNLRYLTY